MRPLEHLIAEAVRKGGLTKLSLYRSPKGWQANVHRDSNGTAGWRCMVDDDPVRALHAALDGPVSAEVVQTPKPVQDEDIFG